MPRLRKEFLDSLGADPQDGGGKGAAFSTKGGGGASEAIKREVRKIIGLGDIAPKKGEDGSDVANEWEFVAKSNPDIGKMMRYEARKNAGKKLKPEQEEFIKSKRPGFDKAVADWQATQKFKNPQMISADPAADFTNQYRPAHFQGNKEKEIVNAIKAGDLSKAGYWVKNSMMNPAPAGESMSDDSIDAIQDAMEGNQEMYGRIRQPYKNGGQLVPDNETDNMKGDFAKTMAEQLYQAQLKNSSMKMPSNGDLNAQSKYDTENRNMKREMSNIDRNIGHVRYNTGQDFGSQNVGGQGYINPNKVVNYPSNAPDMNQDRADRPLGIIANMLDTPITKDSKTGKSVANPKTQLTESHTSLINKIQERLKAGR